MKYFIGFLLSIGILVSPIQSWGVIRECSSIQEVVAEVQPQTLVICDLDNTLMRPCQMLGSEEWFQYYLRQQTEQLHDFDTALQKTIDLLHGIYAVTHVQPMESCTAQVVHQLQQEGVMVMGLTNRAPIVADLTARQLASIGIDLSVSVPSRVSFPLIDIHDNLYRKGILFTSGKSKKNALTAFFKQLSWMPKKIVYINDQRKYLDEASSFEDQGVCVVGLRFSGSDGFAERFDGKVCDEQMKAFSHLMSDREAVEHINENIVGAGCK